MDDSTTRSLLADQAIARLKELAEYGDEESAHAAADTVLCDLLVALGYSSVVESYDSIIKYYA